MTYLTQLLVDFAEAARLGLHDNYDWHQMAWRCFEGLIPRDPDKGRFEKGTKPEEPPPRPADFLMRVDRRESGFKVLLVSQKKPVRPGWCPPGCWETKEVPKEYFSRQQYMFQLCANPTKKVAVQNQDKNFKKNGRREPLRTREDLVSWISRKGEQGGFEVDRGTLRVVPRGREYFERKGQRGLHTAVEYQGVLSVKDSDRFYEAFTRGVGSAKGFGFGLLMVVPVA